MTDRELLLGDAKSCHSKQSWEAFFINNSSRISSLESSKSLVEIFSLLLSDPQSPKYDPTIFGILLKGCLTSRNFKLADRIFHFVKAKSLPGFSIPAINIFLETNKPALSRTLAQRSLRSTQLGTLERVQLEALLCRSLAEEAKFDKAEKNLAYLMTSFNQMDFDREKLAQPLFEIAHSHYLLAHFEKASDFYQTSACSFLLLKDWKHTSLAFYFEARARSRAGLPFATQLTRALTLAEKYNIKSVLYLIYSFYGQNSLRDGFLSDAKAFFIKALQNQPSSELGAQRLDVLSSLVTTYILSGQHELAGKKINQLLSLSANDKSHKHHAISRFLKAVYDWERGEPVVGQQSLTTHLARNARTKILLPKECAEYSRYLYQSAFLKPKVEILKKKLSYKNSYIKSDLFGYHYAQGQLLLTHGNVHEANQHFSTILKEAASLNTIYTSLAFHGLAQTRLATNDTNDSTSLLIQEFESSIKKFDDSILRTKLLLLKSAYAYQTGDFETTKKLMQTLGKARYVEFVDHFAIQCWSRTLRGNTTRLTHPWQIEILARQTRIYFAPSLEVLSDQQYLVANKYTVDLSQHHLLADILDHLVHKPNYSSKIEDLQIKVWKESLSSRGWRQKISNSLVRLRSLFPQTMAPLLIPTMEISLFSDAINVVCDSNAEKKRDNDILRLLKRSSLTTHQISRNLQISTATTKRELKALTNDGTLTAIRRGRNIYYALS